MFGLSHLSEDRGSALFLVRSIFVPGGISFISLGRDVSASAPCNHTVVNVLSTFTRLRERGVCLHAQVKVLREIGRNC